MLPIGPLMIEHRLIERMIALLKKEADRMEREKNADTRFLDFAIEFIVTYADRLHHGKEEDILFKELDKKQMAKEHRTIMSELLEDHRQGRKAVSDLTTAKERYLAGNTGALSEILRQVKFLVEMYPRHVSKEDKNFFLPCMQYFNQQEKDSMLAEEQEFDRRLIHEVYKDEVAREEKRGHDR